MSFVGDATTVIMIVIAVSVELGWLTCSHGWMEDLLGNEEELKREV